MTETRAEVMLGTLDLMVLKLLEAGPVHGWGLAQLLETASDGTFCVNQGSIYPALQRLKAKGLVRSRWGVSENGRRARYYELTRPGLKELGKEVANWVRTSSAVNRVLAFDGGEV
ncbi:MAG TPA: PadR family transcriptional regulator [Gemmatimonadaceae bacterium]|nr:PadR family transcriptional regulator [Gemmatimonadaceae bacterium]